MMRTIVLCLTVAAQGCFCSSTKADVGDPQLRTDHPWYPGELAISSFQRLALTQARMYQRVTGRRVESDEDKALAAWLWRNTHYAHGECGSPDEFGRGFRNGNWVRDYWLGLFAHGFGLCGTTHSQWTAEMEQLLGHGRARSVGVTGHNSFEVFLKGGAYGDGRWVLLDHDVSTVIFDTDGSRLIGIDELKRDLSRLGDPAFKPDRQRGWRVSGLHDADVRGAFLSYRVAEYFSGFAGAPPITHLRSGETLRRYHAPGLDDGKTFVFWGRNYNTGKMAGLERSRTWVNQPEKMFGSRDGSGWRQGQARYANAVYVYRPNFKDGSYRQGVIDEDDSQVTFEFRSPYVIAATPPNDTAWGVYDDGCRNGLVVSGKLRCRISVSADRGASWHDAEVSNGSLDLTDHVKGHQQYWLRFHTGAKRLAPLAGGGLEIRTICQANPSVLPHLKDDGAEVSYRASGKAVLSAGPTVDQAMRHLHNGSVEQGDVTLKLQAPRGEKVVAVHACSWNASGNPPNPQTNFSIDYSTDSGRTWQAIIRDWRIIRRKPEPADFWSQSFSYGNTKLTPTTKPVLIRFHNDGRKPYRRVEAHLVYMARKPAPVRVTFAWAQNGNSSMTASHLFSENTEAQQGWTINTGSNVVTKWVEFAAP